MPTSGGDAIHWPFEPQATVAPDAVRPKLYRVFCNTAVANGGATLDVRDTRRAVTRPRIRRRVCRPHHRCRDESTTERHCSHEPHGLSLDSPSAFASTIGTVGTAGVTSATMKSLVAALLMGLFSIVALAPPANADTVAYLVNVHVRPGYNFPNADAAIGYGNTICDRVAAKMSYAQLVDQVKADFNTADYYQGAYLINQAVNELCPAQIWQLRQSAAGYTLPA